MKQVGDEMKALAIKFKDGGVDAAMNIRLSQILQIGGQLATIETSDTALDNEQNARNTFTEKVTHSVTTMEALSAATQNLVINTDAFNKSLEIMGDMIPSYETAMDAFDAAAPHVTKAIDDAFTWVSTTGKELMQKALSVKQICPRLWSLLLSNHNRRHGSVWSKILADPCRHI